MNQLATIQPEAQQLTAAQVRSHVNLVQEVMRDVMKRGTHYDVIPGCKEPSLLKAGAEKLLVTFRLAAEPDVEDLSHSDEIRYRATVRGIHQVTGQIVGYGVGECSSNEDKYKWRSAVCDEEYNATPEDRRRIKYGRKKGGGHYTVKQIRTESADLANTILKMAKKRALVDLTLTATAASDIFTQDIEDAPDELRDTVNDSRPPPQQPQSRSEKPPQGKLTESQIKVIRAKAEHAALNESDVCKQFKVKAVADIDAAEINNVLEWIANPS